MKPFLSIILPAHNEEQRLPQTLLLVDEFVQKQSFDIEVIVIENASSDRTLDIANSFAELHPYLKVIHEEQPGKGLAVKRGMLVAEGEYRFFCDVDFSMPIDQLPRFFPPQLEGVDIAIGSREAKGAVRYNEPFYRHFVGRVFNLMVWVLALPGINDTQCGFKCFSAKAVEHLFPLQTIDGWAFDVEILAIAKQLGYKIVEVPVPWYYMPQSKVNVIKDFVKTALELFKVRKIIRTKSYARPH